MARLVKLTDAPKHFPIPVTVKTLRNWRARGLYPELFVKIGGTIYVDLDVADRIVEAAKAKSIKDAEALDTSKYLL